MSTATFTVRLPEELKKDVERFASLTNRSRSYIVKEAISSYMQDRYAYLQDINKAIDSIDCQPTYSSDEVFSWMDSWESEKETLETEPNPFAKPIK